MLRSSIRSTLFLSLLLLPILAQANQGSADASEYMWTNSSGSPNIDFEWIDIRGGTGLFGDAFDDSLSSAISLPFTFSFYNTNRSQVWISSNGWLSFVNPNDSTYATNTVIPSGAGANHMLAPFWDNLASSSGNNGGVFYSAVGSAPNRKFIVQWYILNGTPTPDTLHVQVQLHEHTNLIKFQYLTVNAAFGGGQSATIGIKATTSLGNQYSFNTLNAVQAGDAILFHNSSFSQADATVSPSSVQSGEFVTFNYSIDNIEPSSDNDLGKLDRITITNPFTATTPSVTGIKINNTQAFIQNATGKPDDPGFANWNYSGSTLTIETANFDVIDSIRISFSQLIPQVSTGSYNFVSSFDAELDLSSSFPPSPTPNVTVTAGGLSYILIRSAAGGNGIEVLDRPITADSTITIYAAGYDAGDNYIGDQSAADWTVTGTLDGPNRTDQSSYTFAPVLAPTTGSIQATVDVTISDATGTITVSPGDLDALTIRSAPNNGGIPVGIVELTTDDSYTFYAAGYDGDGNYRQDEFVDWTSSLGTFPSGTSLTFSPTAPDTGIITATSGGISDVTGEIRVSGGALDKIIIKDAPNNGGTAVGTRTLTADQSLTLYAAGFDQNNFYIGDQIVDWTVTGTLDGPNTSNQGSYTFSPVLAPTLGSIFATSGGISDATGTITVNPGILDALIIRSAPNNDGNIVTTVDMTTDDSYTFYAAGYDAEGNYRQDEIVDWTSSLFSNSNGSSLTFSPTIPDTGIVTATSGGFSDVTGEIRVTGGVLDHLIISDAPGNTGFFVDDEVLTADQTYTMYAAGYDADDNYIGDQNVEWTVTGTLDGSSVSNQSSYVFSPALAPATGSFIITSGSISDATGTITVNPGILDALIIRSAPNDGGSAVGILNLSTDDSFTFYAAGYDADSNYRGEESVDWTSTLGISSNGTTSITYTPVLPDTGTVTATSGIISDVTGEIRVTSGTLDHLFIRNAAGGLGVVVSDTAITADQTLTLYAAGYDENNNFIGDQIVDWVVTGTLDGSDLLSSSSYTFSPALAPTSGSFTISSGGINDATGTISVTAGALDYIRINASDAAGSGEFLGATLTTDQSVTLYSAGYDADNNYRSPESADWTSTGTLDSVISSGTSYTFSPQTAPSSGTIVATSGIMSDATDVINVIEGALDYLVIRTAPGGLGTVLVDTSITADETLSLWAAGYDGNDNYLNDFSVDWVSTGSLDNINTTSVQFNFTPVEAPASGTLIASSGAISDFTGTISVSVGILDAIKINSSAGAAGVEVTTVTLNAGQPLTLYASGYDSDGNYRSAVSPTWSSTGNLDSVAASGSTYTFTPVTAPTSGTIIATVGGFNDATGIISVEEGDLASIQIRSAAGGLGVVFTDTSITADQTLILYAAGYDANSNYLNDVAVNWTRTGNLDLVLASGTSYTFNPVTAPTSGTIQATSGILSDATGTITVTQGSLASVRVNASAGSAGVEVGAITLTTDDSITLYCASYDADGNYISLVSASWSRIGNLDLVSGTGTTYTFSPSTAPTGGNIRATFGAFNDLTGSITVNPGALAVLQINSGPGPAGVPVLDVTLTVDESLDLYAAGYDAEANYFGPVESQWSTTGSLDVFGATATNVTFTPQTANTAGTIIATASSLIAQTGTITVNEGSLAYLLIRTAPDGGGSILTTASITADQSLTLFAAAYDAGDNFLFNANASWSSTGSLDPVSATDSIFIFSPVTAPTSGTLTIFYLGENASTGLVTVSPGVADTLVDPTAQGGERTTVAGASQLIRVRVEDQHGNPVSGQTVEFEPASRMSDASDVSDADGLAQSTYTTPRDEDNSIVTTTIPGLDTFLFSVYGIRYNSNSLEPKVIMRGNPVSFMVELSNPGNVPVPLSSSFSRIFFSDGEGHSYSADLGSLITIPANTSAYQLSFTSMTIDADFNGGAYTPEVQIVGRGSFSSMNGILLTNPGELTIGDSAITISSAQIIGPSGINQVLQGDNGVNTSITVLNAGIPLSIDPYPQTRIEFRRRSDNSLQPIPTLQRTDSETVLPTNTPIDIQFSFDIPSNYPLDNIDVYTILSLDGGNLVVSPSEPSGSFEVQSAGNATYVENSLDPAQVVERQIVNFRASFLNSGSANIVLDPDFTEIDINSIPVSAATLISQFTLIGNSTTELAFDPITIPEVVTSGDYDIRIRLFGNLVNGSTFDSTYVIDDALEVIDAARVIFANINIPDDIVRQGQQDVAINYTVRNVGQSTAILSDIEHRFTIDGNLIPTNQWIQTDVSPSLPLTINPGAQTTVTETYSIQNSASLGTVTPAPITYYEDQLTQYLPADTSRTILNNDTVVMIRPASIRIENLEMLENISAPNAPIVNENQTFQMELTLNNTGEDLITNTIVDLYRGSSPTPFQQIPITDDIPGGTSITHEFSGSEPNSGFVVYKALINSAIDAIGNTARIDQPLNNNEEIEVQVPSNLTLSPVFDQTSGQNDSATVSVEQVFRVRVNIANSGQSAFGLGDDGEITLRLPQEYLNWLIPEEPDSSKVFNETDEFVEWQIRAHSTTPQSSFKGISFGFLAPFDANTGELIPVSFAYDSISVRVEEKGAITSNTIVIISPAGATDGVLSTEQEFTLQATIEFNASIADTGRTAQLVLPEGFQVSGGAVIYFGDSSNVVQEWIITTPTIAPEPQQIFVTASAFDKNSGLRVQSNSATEQLVVVKKATLDLIPDVEKLNGEESDTLSVGQIFKLNVTLANPGDAGTTGSAKIYLQDIDIHPALVRIDSLSSTSDTLSLSEGNTVSWFLRVERVAQAKLDSLATLLLSLRQQLPLDEIYYKKHHEIMAQLLDVQGELESTQSDIRVAFLDIPLDENTSEQAFVQNQTVTKSIFLQERAKIGDVNVFTADTVSTSQTFAYTVTANPTENLGNAVATLELPSGFTSSPSALTLALDNENRAVWNITVPNLDNYTGTALESITVLIIGEDKNSGEIVSMSNALSSVLTIQAKPKLTMNVEILSPISAKTENVLSLGQEIELKVWPDILGNNKGLTSAEISDTGIIAIDENIFLPGIGEFTAVGDSEKTFTELNEELIFKLRAPDNERTVSINFRYRELPLDKNSQQRVDVDLETGSVSVPIRVRAKEITVTLDFLGSATSFTRGATNNLLMGFTVSNEGYDDTLTVRGLDLKFRFAGNDTTGLTTDALFNMLETVRVIDSDEYLNPGSGRIFAEYDLVEASTTNPLHVPFVEDELLLPNLTQQMVVLADFRSNAVSRKFRAHLTNVVAFDPKSTVPVNMVDEERQLISQSDIFITEDFSVLSNDPKEAFHNYPNPFGQPPNENTKIRFFVQNAGSDVTIRIFTLTGELVKSKWGGVNLNGMRRGLSDGDVTWDGRNDRGVRVLNGVYICALEIRGGGSTERYIIKIAYIK